MVVLTNGGQSTIMNFDSDEDHHIKEGESER